MNNTESAFRVVVKRRCNIISIMYIKTVVKIWMERSGKSLIHGAIKGHRKH